MIDQITPYHLWLVIVSGVVIGLVGMSIGLYYDELFGTYGNVKADRLQNCLRWMREKSQ